MPPFEHLLCTRNKPEVQEIHLFVFAKESLHQAIEIRVLAFQDLNAEWGVPRFLSSDAGLPFTLYAFQQYLIKFPAV